MCHVVTLCLALGADNDDKDDIVENVEDVTHRENVIETHEHIPNIDIFSVLMRYVTNQNRSWSGIYDETVEHKVSHYTGCSKVTDIFSR